MTSMLDGSLAVKHHEVDSGAYTLTLQPSGDRPLTVLFEPGAGQYELGAGSAFMIEVSAPSDETVEFMHGDGFVSIWPSAKLSVRVIDSQGQDLRLLGY